MLSTNISLSQSLNDFRWKNRILVISSPETSRLTKDQIKKFTSAKDAFLERKLLLFIQTKKGCSQVNIETGDINSDLTITNAGIDPSKFKIQLIGLDGTTKFISQDLVSPEAIFNRIDQMPMRRSEIRKKN